MKYVLTEKAPEHFTKAKKPVEQNPTVETAKKFNLRLSKQDYEFIKFLASEERVSANEVLDDLISRIIFNFLDSLDASESSLLIKVADRLNGVETLNLNNVDKTWLSNVFPPYYDPAGLEAYGYNFHESITETLKSPNCSETYKHMFKSLQNSTAFQELLSQKEEKKHNETN
ncbi:MAG TPA: hypothetical protein PLF28_04280 [Agitococcus sp.]|nr:hypothetical protein [Agitococcus sp.]